jgi:ketosteroid isomerase-like protein
MDSSGPGEILSGRCRRRTWSFCAAPTSVGIGGDFGWATELPAPEFEYLAADIAGISGHFRGAEGFLRFLEQFWEGFEEAHAEPEEFIEAGDSVLAVINFSGRGKQSGAEVNMEIFQLWTFRDGKITRGQGFFDREEALEAAGLRE